MLLGYRLSFARTLLARLAVSLGYRLSLAVALLPMLSLCRFAYRFRLRCCLVIACRLLERFLAGLAVSLGYRLSLAVAIEVRTYLTSTWQNQFNFKSKVIKKLDKQIMHMTYFCLDAPLSAQLDGDPHSRSASASTGADLRFRLVRLDRCR